MIKCKRPCPTPPQSIDTDSWRLPSFSNFSRSASWLRSLNILVICLYWGQKDRGAYESDPKISLFYHCPISNQRVQSSEEVFLRRMPSGDQEGLMVKVEKEAPSMMETPMVSLNEVSSSRPCGSPVVVGAPPSPLFESINHRLSSRKAKVL